MDSLFSWLPYLDLLAAPTARPSEVTPACLPACLARLSICLPACSLLPLSLSLSLSNLSIYLSVFIHRISILSALPVYLPATQGTSSSSPFVSLIETHSFDPRLHTVNYIYRKAARRIGWKRGHASWESGWPLLTSPPPLPSFLPWFIPVGTRSCNFPRPWLRALVYIYIYIYVCIYLSLSLVRLFVSSPSLVNSAWTLGR